MKALICLIPCLLALAGCGPAISTGSQQQAGPRVSFQELSAHSDKYQGQLEILGGEVMSVKPLGEGSLLAVDQRDLDGKFYPAGKISGGTFLVESSKWLSPSQYQPQSKVAVAGVVAGKKDGVLLLQAREVYFWEAPPWEEWYYPVPRHWYPPELEYWYTPPYWNPRRPGGRGF
jgi:starvation-inducible outer membrane lipoprotein